MWIIRPSILFCIVLSYMGTGAYKGLSYYQSHHSQRPKASGCQELQCLDPRNDVKYFQQITQDLQNSLIEHNPQIIQDTRLLEPIEIQNSNLKDLNAIDDSTDLQDKQNRIPLVSQETAILNDNQALRNLEESLMEGSADKSIRDFVDTNSMKRTNNAVGKRNRNQLTSVNNKHFVPGFSRSYRFDSPHVSGLQGTGFDLQPPNCACAYERKWEDLGPLRFPRYYRSMKCTSRPCWLEPFACRERNFTMWVLKQREPGDPEHPTPLLPEELRAGFMFEEVIVTVGCVCSTPSTLSN